MAALLACMSMVSMPGMKLLYEASRQADGDPAPSPACRIDTHASSLTLPPHSQAGRYTPPPFAQTAAHKGVTWSTPAARSTQTQKKSTPARACVQQHSSAHKSISLQAASKNEHAVTAERVARGADARISSPWRHQPTEGDQALLKALCAAYSVSNTAALTTTTSACKKLRANDAASRDTGRAVRQSEWPPAPPPKTAAASTLSSRCRSCSGCWHHPFSLAPALHGRARSATARSHLRHNARDCQACCTCAPHARRRHHQHPPQQRTPPAQLTRVSHARALARTLAAPTPRARQRPAPPSLRLHQPARAAAAGQPPASVC